MSARRALSHRRPELNPSEELHIRRRIESAGVSAGPGDGGDGMLIPNFSDLMIPFTDSYHRIEPGNDVEAAARKIEALHSALTGGPLTPREEEDWAFAGFWIEDVRHGEKTAPAELLNTLAQLPSILREGRPAGTLIEMLFWMKRLPASITSSMTFGSSRVAGLALDDVLAVRAEEALDLLSVLWTDVLRAERGIDPPWLPRWSAFAEELHRRHAFERLMAARRKERPPDALSDADLRRGTIVQAARAILGTAGRINLPRAYELLRSALQHPWPEIRNSGGKNSGGWHTETLAEELVQALLMGRNDHLAPKNSPNLLFRLTSTKDPIALSCLRQLEGTAFDNDRLQRSIRRLAGQLPAQQSPRTAPRHDPSHLWKGSTPGTIRVTPLRAHLPPEPGAPQMVCVEGAIRVPGDDTQWIGSVKVELRGRGATAANAEQLAEQVLRGIWPVERPERDAMTPQDKDKTDAPPQAAGTSTPVLFDKDRRSPVCLVRTDRADLYLIEERDYRPYHMGIAVYLELREDGASVGELQIHASWRGAANVVLDAAVGAASVLWLISPKATLKNTILAR